MGSIVRPARWRRSFWMRRSGACGELLISVPNHYCPAFAICINAFDDGRVMLRFMSMFSLGGGFLMISPKLRLLVTSNFEGGVHKMEFYSPYSYIGAGVAGIIAMVIILYRVAQQR